MTGGDLFPWAGPLWSPKLAGRGSAVTRYWDRNKPEQGVRRVLAMEALELLEGAECSPRDQERACFLDSFTASSEAPSRPGGSCA